MITTVGDLVTYIRQELNSETIGGVDTYSLWKDNEIIDYIDQAQQEFSRLTLCIPDYSTYSIAISSGTREYTYDSKIIQITGGWLSTVNKRIRGTSFDQVEKGALLNSDNIINHGDWESTTNIPIFAITDLMIDKIILYPTPSIDDTLTLYCFKEADHVSSTSDNLEIDSQYRLGLTYRVMALAYGKHDALETEDLQRSTMYSQKWASFVNDAKEAYNKRFNRT